MKKVLACIVSFVFITNVFLNSMTTIIGSTVGIPETPTGVSATSTETSITVSWSSVIDAVSYVVNFSGTEASTDSTSYTFDNLPSGTSYSYQVKAVGIEGDSSYSSSSSISTITVVVPIIPDIPSDIYATSTETTVTVSWSEANNAVSYDIVLDGNSVNTTGTSHTFSDLTSGTSYSYKVRSVGTEQNSSFSSLANINTIEVIIPKVPNVPSGIATTKTEDSVTVSWTGDETAMEYTLVFNDISYTTPLLSYTVNGLTPSTTYEYKVKATNDVGSSKYSSTASVTTQDHIPLVPLTPVDIDATATEFTVAISWSPSTEATLYHILFDGTEVTTTQMNYTFTELKSSTEYTYQVKASNITGSSNYSSSKTIKTKLEIPTVPTGISLTSTSRGVTINWNVSQYATSYDVSFDSEVKNTISTSYSIEDLEPNTLHTIKIRAKNLSGTSEYSDVKSISTLQEIPITPTGVTFMVTERTITLNWEPSIRADSYEVSIGSDILLTTNTNYIFRDLEPDTLYIVKVRAKNSAGVSEFSSDKNATTKEEIPSAPENIKATANTRAVTISWDKVVGAKSYEVDLSGIRMITTSTSVTFNNLSSNTTYTYFVKSKNGVGTSEASITNTIRTYQEVPSIPQKIVATATEKTVTLSWERVSDSTSYDVSFDGEVKNTVNTSITFTLLNPDTSYSFKIRAVNDAGGSPFSTLRDIRTEKARLLVLTVPKQVSAVLDNNSIVISWQPVTGADSYDINVNGVIRSTVDTRLVVDSIQSNTNYDYSVRANNTEGSSEYSEIKSIRSKDSIPVTPTLTTTSTTDSVITLNWTKIDNATSYEIIIDGVTKSTSDTSISLSGLQPNTSYKIKLRAKNFIGVSPYSVEKSYMTQNVLPGVPVVNTTTANSSSVYISWSNVKAATSYEVKFNDTVYKTTKTNITITNLNADVEHTFSIRAINEMGGSLYSSSRTIRTSKGIVEIQITSIDDSGLTTIYPNDSFIIQWKPVITATKYSVKLLNTTQNKVIIDITGDVTNQIIDTNLLDMGLYELTISGFDSEDTLIGKISKKVEIIKGLANILPNTKVVSLENEAFLTISFESLPLAGVTYNMRVTNVFDGTVVFEQMEVSNLVQLNASLFGQASSNIRLYIEAIKEGKIVAQSNQDFEVIGKSVHLEIPDIVNEPLDIYISTNSSYVLQWKNSGEILPEGYLIYVYRNNLLFFTEDNIAAMDGINQWGIPSDVFSVSGIYMIEVIATKPNYKDSLGDYSFIRVGSEENAFIRTLVHRVSSDFEFTLQGVVDISDVDRIEKVGFYFGMNSSDLNEITVPNLSESGHFELNMDDLEYGKKYYYSAFLDLKNGTHIQDELRSFVYLTEKEAMDKKTTIPEIHKVSYKETVNEADNVTGLIEGTEPTNNPVTFTFTITTDNLTNGILFVNHLGVEMVYKSTYENFGENRIWTVFRNYRQPGVYQEKIYGINGSIVSQPLVANLIVGKTTMLEEEIELTNESLPEEISGMSNQVVFDGLIESMFIVSNESKIDLKGRIISQSGSFIKEINFIVADNIEHVYKKRWYSSKEKIEITIDESIKIKMADGNKILPVYVYVLLENGTVSIHTVHVTLAELELESSPFISEKETIDLRLYAVMDNENRQCISENVTFESDNTMVAMVIGNQLKALKAGQVGIKASYELDGAYGSIVTTVTINQQAVDYEKISYDNMKRIDQSEFASVAWDVLYNGLSSIDDDTKTISSSGSAYCALATVVNALDISTVITPSDISREKRKSGESYATYFDANTDTVGKLFITYLYDRTLSNVTKVKYTSFTENGLVSRIVDSINEDKPIIALMAGDINKVTSSNVFTDSYHYVVINGVKEINGNIYVHIIDSSASNYTEKDKLKRWYDNETGRIWVPIRYIVTDIVELNIIN